MAFCDSEARLVLKDEKGFTLIELIVTLALCSVLLVILTDGLLQWQRQKEQVLAENELAENLNYAMSELAYDLRQTVCILPQTEADKLVLINETGDTISYELSVDTMSEEHPYQLAGQVLYRKENGGRRQPIANFLSEMIIRYPEEGEAPVRVVQISLSGQTPAKTLSLERTLSVGGYYWRTAGRERGL